MKTAKMGAIFLSGLTAILLSVVLFTLVKDRSPAASNLPSVDARPAIARAAPQAAASASTISSDPPIKAPQPKVASFDESLRSVLGSGESSLHQLYAQAMASGSPADRYLAFRIHDICLPHIRHFPIARDNPYPDGDAMRRGTAIKAAMRERCGGFHRMQVTDFIREGGELRTWMIASDNPA